MGRLTVAGVEQELRATYGNQSEVARRFGVSRVAVHNYISRHPRLQQALTEANEAILDNGESALFAAVLRGEPWAVKWLLATKGKARGYVERQEVSGPEGKPIEIRAVDYRVAITPLKPEDADA